MSFVATATQPTQKSKDQVLWVSPRDTRAGPLDLNGFECPKCLQSIQDGPCGREMLQSLACFKNSTDPNKTDCFQYFIASRDCMYKHPLQYFEYIRNYDL